MDPVALSLKSVVKAGSSYSVKEGNGRGVSKLEQTAPDTA